MELYTKPGKMFDTIVNENLNGKEHAVLSIPLKYDGKIYRKILYYETKMAKSGPQTAGIVFISEDGRIIKDKEIKKQLVMRFRRLELLMGPRSAKRFKNAYTSEKQFQIDERDYKDMIETMEVLKEKGTEGTESVCQMFKNLPAAKREINDAVEVYRKCLDKCNAQTDKADARDIDSLYEAYLGVMAANFKKLKLINTASHEYVSVRKAAIKIRRSIKMIFTYGNIKKGLSDIDYQFSYFSKLLAIYKDVIHMSLDRYKAYLRDMENHEVTLNMELLR